MGPVACEILAELQPSQAAKPSVTSPESPAKSTKGLIERAAPEQHSESDDLYPLLVGVRRACELLGIGNTMIYRLIGAGKIRTVKIGGRTLIETASLRALASTGG
jgi:excisionase family DNA binding protein